MTLIPVDPIWLLIPALVLFTVWMIYEHLRMSGVGAALGQEQAARELTEQLLVNSNKNRDEVFAQHTHQDLKHEHPYALLGHGHSDLSPLIHDHTGGIQGHVHWLKYNSTELTDGKRRDVYVCLVPDCKAIFAHLPEM